MDWIGRLERKFGKYAIHNLMYYIIIMYIIGFVLELVVPAFYSTYLALNAEAVLHGQIWRIFTFLFQPPRVSIVFMIFELYLFNMIGNSLEETWGAFRFNVYFFSGILLHIIAAIVIYLVTGVSLSLGTSYLNLSLFFAFAALYPNVELMFMAVVPIKVKYLALVDGIFFLYTIIQAFLPQYGGGVAGSYYHAQAVAAGVSLLNFLIFYVSSHSVKTYTVKQKKRKHKFKQEVRKAQPDLGNGVHHRCAVCGRTDLDDPSLEFRYCSKCNGSYEYCQDHLFTHEHVK